MKVTLVVLTAILAATCAYWVKEMENEGVFEGDIVVDDEEGRCKNLFASIKGGRWSDAKIPYVIDSSIGHLGKIAINAAIADFHKYTCLRFSQRTSEGSYIKFYRGSGCSSPVGYRSGRVNGVSLASGCWYKGTVMHEIGHSIGLYHEQSRPDRDNYVEIVSSNIQRSMRFNFNKQAASTINSLGTGYDYKSMMHYGKTAFGNGRLTVKTKDSTMQNVIGNRGGFSETDIKQINLMYCGGVAQIPPGGDCEDIAKDCQKNIGGCSEWGLPWKDYMNIYCKKTCNFC